MIKKQQYAKGHAMGMPSPTFYIHHLQTENKDLLETVTLIHIMIKLRYCPSRLLPRTPMNEYITSRGCLEAARLAS
jgi:hypothetical protein